MTTARAKTAPASEQENLSERDYKDRAYLLTRGSVQHVYLYLIDRMEKRPGEVTPQGTVMRPFATETRIAEHTGLDQDYTVKHGLAELVRDGLIRVWQDQDRAGHWRTKKIQLAPLGKFFDNSESTYVQRYDTRIRKRPAPAKSRSTSCEYS